MTPGPIGSVIDASALLAYLLDEPGGGAVRTALTSRAVMNIVNYAEVLTRLSVTGNDPAGTHRRLIDQGLIGGLLDVIGLTDDDALAIARLRRPTQAHGLSLGDRACLATGLRLGWPVVTADRTWADVNVGVVVQVIRP